MLIDQDAVVKLTIDFIDWLETGETLSSVSATARSCTVSVSTTSPRTTITISDVTSHTDGDITIVTTSSTGEKYREIIRVRRTNRYTDEALVFSDYV